MEVLGGILSGIGGVAGLVLIGYVIALATSSPGTATITTGTPPPGDPCAKACMDWRTARLAVCGAQMELDAAIRTRDTCFQAWLGILASAAAFLAASVAAMFIPFFGAGIAAGLFSASATLLAAAAILGGIYTGAAAAVATKQDVLGKRQIEEQLARLKVHESCPPAEATACLANPPC